MNLKKMCVMCKVLSPNCCAVTIFEYSIIEVTLPSRLSVPSEHVAPQSKWQSADLDLLKLAKKRKRGQRYSEVTCAFSLRLRKPGDEVVLLFAQEKLFMKNLELDCC